MIDLTAISQWCISITGILIFLKWISAPVKHVLDNNKKTMESLQDSIEKLAEGLKENQFNFKTSAEDRKLLHKVQDAHETRIGLVEDKTIIHDEQIKTLFKMKEDKK